MTHAIENEFSSENLATKFRRKNSCNIPGFIWSPGARCGVVG